MYKVPAAGGATEAVTSLDPERQEVSHRLPSFLPDSDHYLFVVQSGKPEYSGLYLGSLGSSRRVRFDTIDSRAEFLPEGFIVFRRENTLMAQPFDTERLELLDQPVPVGEPVGGKESDIFGEANFSVSSTGVIAYQGSASGLTELAWYDRSGERIGSIGAPSTYTDVGLAPNATKVAFGKLGTSSSEEEIWLQDAGRQATSRFTFEYDWGPVFSPSGEWLAFGSLRRGASDILLKSIATGEIRVLLETSDFVGPTDWSSDGQIVLYANHSTSDVGVVAAEGGEPRPLLQSDFVEKDGELSPDGQWIAYTSNESGRWEVYVQSFPDLTGKQVISTEGGSHPKWRGDGKEMFYLGSDRRVMAVPVTTEPRFEAGRPVPIVDAPVVGHPFKSLYDVTGDGQRFLINTPIESEDSPITIVLGWASALSQ